MIKLSLLVLLLTIFIGCSQKIVESKPKKVEEKKAILSKQILPYSKDIYSFEKYARFMYNQDCSELSFRKDDLMKSKFKKDPLEIMNIISEIEKNLTDNHCD